VSRDITWHRVPTLADPAGAAELIAELRARYGHDAPLVFETGTGRLNALRIRELDQRIVLLELEDGQLRVVPLNRIERIGCARR
jgi:hypothetical protein